MRPMRVELIWIAPPPPQDGASTNFATAADSINLREKSLKSEFAILAWNLLRLRGRSSRLRRICLICVNRLRLFDGSQDSRGGCGGLFERSGTQSQSDGSQEKERGSHSRGARQEVRRARSAEDGTARATAEGSTEVGAFTVLQQDQNDHGDRGDDLHHDCDGDQHGGHLYYFPLTQKWF